MDVPITLPRPRSLSTEFTSEFKDYVQMIRNAIYAERKER
jgi:hypothetical protein